jgi:endonuclease-3
MTRQERAAKLVEVLPQVYPDAHCELNFSNALELLVATILSAQCTDKRVNIVTAELFRRCRSAQDYVAIPTADLEAIIRTAGFYRAKAKSLQKMAAALVANFGGEVPRDLPSLTSLAGVGRKTANVVLGNAYGIESGVVVDTHVGRLSLRLGLTKQTDPEKVELDLMKLIPRDRWTLFSHWLIFHGRRRCFARNPDCAGCELRTFCPTAFQHGPQKKRSTVSANAGNLTGRARRLRSAVPEDPVADATAENPNL